VRLSLAVAAGAVVLALVTTACALAWHDDAWVGALILVALALSQSRRLQAAGAMWALAIAVKWVPIIFLSLRAVEARATGRRTGHKGFAITAAAVVALAGVL